MIPLTFTLACVPTQTPPAAAPEAAAQPVGASALDAAIERGQIPDLTREMNDHYIDALRFEMAVIGGDLDGARQQAAILAKMTAPEGLPHPEVAEPFLAQVHAAAQRAAEASDLSVAAYALGDLAQACGHCHTVTSGGPQDVPPAPDTKETMMSLHLHGAYWLGYGLFAPNDAAWKSGVAALAASRTADGTPTGAGAAEKIERLTEFARTANVEARPGVWAEILATCSDCHGPIRPDGTQ